MPAPSGCSAIIFNRDKHMVSGILVHTRRAQHIRTTAAASLADELRLVLDNSLITSCSHCLISYIHVYTHVCKCNVKK